MKPDTSQIVDGALMTMLNTMIDTDQKVVTIKDLENILDTTDFTKHVGVSLLEEVLRSLLKSMLSTGHEVLSQEDIRKLLKINKELK
jgi:hypothetical protein